MKTVNDLIHENDLMNADVHAKSMNNLIFFLPEQKKKKGIEVSRGNNLKRTVISREYYYNFMPSLKLLTMW